MVISCGVQKQAGGPGVNTQVASQVYECTESDGTKSGKTSSDIQAMLETINGKIIAQCKILDVFAHQRTGRYTFQEIASLHKTDWKTCPLRRNIAPNPPGFSDECFSFEVCLECDEGYDGPTYYDLSKLPSKGDEGPLTGGGTETLPELPPCYDNTNPTRAQIQLGLEYLKNNKSSFSQSGCQIANFYAAYVQQTTQGLVELGSTNSTPTVAECKAPSFRRKTIVGHPFGECILLEACFQCESDQLYYDLPSYFRYP